MSPEERKGLIYVALAVIFFATTPVFIVRADPMDPIVKTWGRMLVAASVVGLAAWLTTRRKAAVAQPERTHTRRNATTRFLAYGLIAALHFLFYIASLSFTTAAHSLSIVYTAPIFVTILSAVLLKEAVRPRQWVGVGITVLGVAILAGLEPRMSWEMAFGDLLALFSAITFGFYSVAGRYERDRYPLLVYASRVYGAAALWLLLPALLVLPSMPPAAWGWTQLLSVVALGIGPLALGHTLYNASLRRTHATYVNIIASQEVTGGIILSWLLLSQVPTPNSLAG
ncbi:MAG TPA: DMT family transporter, partial [Chloroflexia bacterium]|nr:DMT family transporter [Chloroflexia bacterium]